jgi:hypothetical protein
MPNLWALWGRLHGKGADQVKVTKEDKLSEARKAVRAKSAKAFRYPYGLLTIIDLICPPPRRKRPRA